MILRRGRDGDPGRQLAELYREHAAAVFAFAVHLHGCREDAEDVVQTAFLHAHRAIARGEQLVNPRAWLITVVKRQSFNLWRDRREVPAAELPVAARIDDGEAAAELARVRTTLFSLPEAQHQAFVLRHWSGLSNREIAQVLDTSESAVESLLVRARAAILAGSAGDGECAGVRERLAGGLQLSGPQRGHLRGCGGCMRAQKRLARISTAAAVLALVPRVHVAHALAATVPGFSAGAVAGAGTSAGAGVLAKTAGAKATVAVIAAVVAISAASPLAVHALHAHQHHSLGPGAAAAAMDDLRPTAVSRPREAGPREAIPTPSDESNVAHHRRRHDRPAQSADSGGSAGTGTRTGTGIGDGDGDSQGDGGGSAAQSGDSQGGDGSVTSGDQQGQSAGDGSGSGSQSSGDGSPGSGNQDG